jgi:hypothetical protein
LLLNESVRKFLKANSQLSCDKITSQTFANTNDNASTVECMRELAQLQRQETEKLLNRIKQSKVVMGSQRSETDDYGWKRDHVEVEKEVNFMDSDDH